MSVINQTNRTILFEEINPEKLDLLTLVGDVKGMDSLNDDKIKEINRHLLVHNFDEFLEKFSPVVYSFYNAANQKVMYTLKKPEHIPDAAITEIVLNQQNDFLKMLFSLVDTKRSQGIINVDFKFENLLDMISPKKVMDDIRQVRKELRYTYGKYAELDEGDPQKLDIADKLNVMFEEASVNYNNVMAMLPLAIEDSKTRLLLGEAEQAKDDTPLKLGVLSMGEDGELKIIEAPNVTTTALATLDDQANQGLIAALEEDYEAINDMPSDYVKSLVVRTFCPLQSTTDSEVNLEREVANYNTYLEFYKVAKDDFIKVVKPLAETILGVKAYFDQYATKAKGMRPTLLITNTKLDMLTKSSNIPRLITFLNTTNGKNDFSDSIWFGIVPRISLDKNDKITLRRERFKGNEKVTNTNTNSLENLSRILDVVKDYRVQVFFDFELSEDTTFNHVATAGIEAFIDRTASLAGKEYSEFSIPCLPNFTVIPKDKSGVVIDSRMIINDNNNAELSKEKEDIMKLWIEGVYIGASYVAAGLVSAYQCPWYLKERVRKIDPNNPGVRFDIEAGTNALQVTTTMPKEITGFTNSIKDEINRKNFGFVFSSENAQIDGLDIRKIMVYKARSLLSYNNDFEPIYKTLVTTYIERILRHASSDFKQDNIVAFFSNNPQSQKSKWMAQKEFNNAIIAASDDIDYSIDKEEGICNLDIIFNGNAKNLEVKIRRMTAKD